MIGRTERLSYIGGRLAARFGARPRAMDWARLHAVDDADSYVDAARRTPVATLMDGLAAGQPVHVVEAALRRQWRSEVDRVARWHLPADRPVIAWLSSLADLPAIEHLAHHGAVLDWMGTDTSLAAYVAAASGEVEALTTDPGTAIFAAAFSGAESAGTCWLSHWKTLWPSSRAERDALEKLVLEITGSPLNGRGGGLAIPGPDALDRVFEATYRRHGRGVAASVAWLGMVGNDLRRLRGEVAARLAMPSLQGHGATP